MKFLLALLLLVFSYLPVNAAASAPWQVKVRQELPLLGHRNWIMIVDSAYPWQISPGVETVETNADEITVVRIVLDELSHSSHVRPVVFMDAELPFVTEQEAPGVTQYRRQIRAALGDLPVHSALHDQLIHPNPPALPAQNIRQISAKTGQGVAAAWLDEIFSGSLMAESKILDIDYEQYARAEAALVWLNLQIRIEPDVVC